MLNYFNEKDDSDKKSDSSPEEPIQRFFAPGAPAGKTGNIFIT